MKIFTSFTVLTVSLLLVIGCSRTKPPATPETPVDTTSVTVVDSTVQDTTLSEVVVEADTLSEVSLTEAKLALELSAPEQLTFGKADNGIGSFTPDGRKILFQSNKDGIWQIYELDLEKPLEELVVPDSTTPEGQTTVTDTAVVSSQANVTKLFESNYNDEFPVSTPDGSRVLFVSDRDRDAYSLSDYQGNIYLYNRGDGSVTRLTDHPADDWFPVSVDNESFLFLTERDVSADMPDYLLRNSLYKGFFDGRVPEPMLGADFDPNSPIYVEGGSLYFKTNAGRLVEQGSDSTGLKPLTPTTMRTGIAHYSKTGNLYVLTAKVGDRYKLFILDSATSSYELIETGEGELRYPQVSPDGSQIIFSKEQDGNFQLFRIRVTK